MTDTVQVVQAECSLAELFAELREMARVAHLPRLAVEGDDRPGMGWNDHLVYEADPNMRVAFMANCGNLTNFRSAYIVAALNAMPTLLAPEALAALTRPIKGEGEVRALREALQTARDYVSDAANGVLVYRGAGRVDPVMAESDLIRIEAALKPTPDEGG